MVELVVVVLVRVLVVVELVVVLVVVDVVLVVLDTPPVHLVVVRVGLDTGMNLTLPSHEVVVDPMTRLFSISASLRASLASFWL